MQPAATDQTRPFWRSAGQRSWQRTATGPAPLDQRETHGFGKILTGNPRFSHEIWGFPVIFPLNQSHWIVGDSNGMIYGEPVEHVMFVFLAYKMVVYIGMMGIEWEYHRENSEWLTLRPYFFRRSSGMMGLSSRVTILKWLNYLSIKPMVFHVLSIKPCYWQIYPIMVMVCELLWFVNNFPWFSEGRIWTNYSWRGRLSVRCINGQRDRTRFSVFVAFTTRKTGSL